MGAAFGVIVGWDEDDVCGRAKDIPFRIDADIFRLRSFLVKAWNYSSWPAYRSRFWNKDQVEAQSRRPYV